MASIDSMTFDKPEYTQGELITLTVHFTPDTPSVVPTAFTVNVSVTDAAGTATAASSAPFTVNLTQAGDKVAVTDSGNRTWAESSDTGTVAVFTATA